jgi:hypothetical protein
MAFFSRRKLLVGMLCFGAAFLCAGCSDDATGPAELEPLVGTWRAQVLTLTNQANPETVVRLIEEGATFTLSVLSTGQYQAVLQIFGQSNPELGNVSVSGNQITLTPVNPPGPTTTGTWRFQGDTLILDGDTEFDFNLDQINEQATVHFELVRIEL